MELVVGSMQNTTIRPPPTPYVRSCVLQSHNLPPSSPSAMSRVSAHSQTHLIELISSNSSLPDRSAFTAWTLTRQKPLPTAITPTDRSAHGCCSHAPHAETPNSSATAASRVRNVSKRIVSIFVPMPLNRRRGVLLKAWPPVSDASKPWSVA